MDEAKSWRQLQAMFEDIVMELQVKAEEKYGDVATRAQQIEIATAKRYVQLAMERLEMAEELTPKWED